MYEKLGVNFNFQKKICTSLVHIIQPGFKPGISASKVHAFLPAVHKTFKMLLNKSMSLVIRCRRKTQTDPKT